jgi:hypothetical protein
VVAPGLLLDLILHAEAFAFDDDGVGVVHRLRCSKDGLDSRSPFQGESEHHARERLSQETRSLHHTESMVSKNERAAPETARPLN